MNKRSKMAYETKTRIVNAGLKLFEQGDWDSVSVSELMRAAGVKRTSFYAYFKSKDDIVGLVIADLDEEYKAFYDTTLRSGSLSPLEQLEMLLKQSNRIMTHNGAALLRYYYIRMLRAPAQPLTKRYYDSIVWELIDKCSAQGLLNALYTNEDIFYACLAFNRSSCMEWALCNGARSIESWDGMLSSFCRSIGV